MSGLDFEKLAQQFSYMGLTNLSYEARNHANKMEIDKKMHKMYLKNLQDLNQKVIKELKKEQEKNLREFHEDKFKKQRKLTDPIVEIPQPIMEYIFELANNSEEKTGNVFSKEFNLEMNSKWNFICSVIGPYYSYFEERISKLLHFYLEKEDQNLEGTLVFWRFKGKWILSKDLTSE